MSQCKAKSKRTGNQCQANAMRGKEVCYHHGGKSKKGIASATFKTGRYSTGNANLVARYNDALANPTILSLKEDLATIDVRLNVLWEQLEGSGTQQAWVDLDKQYKQLKIAYRRGETDKLSDTLNEIGRLIEEGNKDTKLWAEFMNAQDHRRKLFESQSKHFEREKNYTRNDLLLLAMGAILELIVKEVDDRDIRTKLSEGMDSIMNSTLIAGEG